MSYKLKYSGQEIDNKLDNVGWTLLWENASPTSSFVSQRISINLTNYSKLAIVGYYGKTNIIDLNSLKQDSMQNFLNEDSDGLDIYIRKLTITSTEIIFENCLHTFIETIDGVVGVRRVTSNQSLIPYKIYGFN